jgi:hypothetical protein
VSPFTYAVVGLLCLLGLVLIIRSYWVGLRFAFRIAQGVRLTTSEYKKVRLQIGIFSFFGALFLVLGLSLMSSDLDLSNTNNRLEFLTLVICCPAMFALGAIVIGLREPKGRFVPDD